MATIPVLFAKPWSLGSMTLLQSRVLAYNAAAPTLQFSSPCTNGSLIVVAATHEENTTIFNTCSDNINGSYGAVVVQRTTPGASAGMGQAAIWSKNNTSNSAVTVSMTISISQPGELCIFEFSNPSASPVHAFTSGAGTGTLETMSLTTSIDSCAIVAIGVNYGGNAFVADGGYTSMFAEYNSGWSYHEGEYIVNSGVAGNKTVTMGKGNSSQWAAVMAAFRPA